MRNGENVENVAPLHKHIKIKSGEHLLKKKLKSGIGGEKAIKIDCFLAKSGKKKRHGQF